MGCVGRTRRMGWWDRDRMEMGMGWRTERGSCRVSCANLSCLSVQLCCGRYEPANFPQDLEMKHEVLSWEHRGTAAVNDHSPAHCQVKPQNRTGVPSQSSHGQGRTTQAAREPPARNHPRPGRALYNVWRHRLWRF